VLSVSSISATNPLLTIPIEELLVPGPLLTFKLSANTSTFCVIVPLGSPLIISTYSDLLVTHPYPPSNFILYQPVVLSTPTISTVSPFTSNPAYSPSVPGVFLTLRALANIFPIAFTSVPISPLSSPLAVPTTTNFILSTIR